MDNCFSGDKQGKIAKQKYEKIVKLWVEKELKKCTISKFDSEEMNKAYQNEIRMRAEERIIDELL